MPPQNYSYELDTALKAVHLAGLLTKSHLLSYQSKQSKVSEETKADASEVTTADFAAQAVLISIIHHVFPEDEFIAEESGDMLRKDTALLERVWALVSSAKNLLSEAISKDIEGFLPRNKEDMIEVIELGQQGGRDAARTARTWILDPIDGTKTYIRAQQYAVCLCLIEDGEQKVGILGCPNLNVETIGAMGRVVIDEFTVDLAADGGWILSAVKDHGLYVSRIRDPNTRMNVDDFLAQKNVSITSKDTTNQPTNGTASSYSKRTGNKPAVIIEFTDSSASPHISKDLHNHIFEIFAAPSSNSSKRKLSVPAVPEGSPSLAVDIWSMQLKYVLLALRAEGADAMIRTPPTSEYHAAVWDHAGGQLLLMESGGSLTDANGKAFLVNGQMRKLNENWGVCGVRGGQHRRRDGGMIGAAEAHSVLLERVVEEVGARRRKREALGKDD